LKSTPDGDGSLLDHTLIFWASNMSDGNLHSHKAVPNMLIGGAMGQSSRRPAHPAHGNDGQPPVEDAPHVGIEQEYIGDSTEPLVL